MTESAGAAHRFADGLYLLPGYLLYGRDHHLRDPVAMMEGLLFHRKISEDDLDLAPVVGIDGAGRIEAGDAMLDGHAAAGTDLRFIAQRQLDKEAGRHQLPFQGLQDEGIGEIGTYIHAG